MAIEADFAGPYWSPGPGEGVDQASITVDEYRAVTRLFPRGGFSRGGFKLTICTLCQAKTDTTFDNFAGGFGRRFGYDGQGEGKEEYGQVWEKRQLVGPLLEGLDSLDRLDSLE